MTELTPSVGKVKTWKVGPEGNDRKPSKTRESEIGTGGTGITTIVRGKSWNHFIEVERTVHYQTRLEFVLDFVSRLLEMMQNPFGKSLEQEE